MNFNHAGRVGIQNGMVDYGANEAMVVGSACILMSERAGVQQHRSQETGCNDAG